MRAAAEQEYVSYVSTRLEVLWHMAHLLCGDPYQADDLVPETITKPSLIVDATWSINSRDWIASGTADRPFASFGDRALPLPLPGGATPGSGTIATTISDDGRVIGGQSAVSNSHVVPLRWSCA